MRRLLLITLALSALAAPSAAAAATGSGGLEAAEDPVVTGTTGGTLAKDAAPATSAQVGGVAPFSPTPTAPAKTTAAGAAPSAPGATLPATAVSGPSAPGTVPYAALINATARRYGLAPTLLTALVWKESAFNPKAKSPAGARGLTQLMPATAKELGVVHRYDPAENLDGGARYLKAMLVRFGSVKLALAAYNAGAQNVVKHKGIPPFEETRTYVRDIVAYEASLRGYQPKPAA